MRHAETVTFGGSGLDRAAEVRGKVDPGAETNSQNIVLWRGKLLVHGPDFDSLVRLNPDHSVLAGADIAPVLLGRDESGALIFVHDISSWVPEGLDEEAIAAFIDLSEQYHPALPDDVAFVELRRIMTRLSPRDAELAATAKAVIGWHQTHKFCARCGEKSEVVQSGWQRNCPACGGQHFPRTDPVVIMLITSGEKTLLGRSPGWPEGMYSCLAGFVEPGETIEAAVRREVLEEVGVRVGPVRYLASQPWAFPSSLMFGCHGEALSEELKIDPLEIEDAIWVSKSEVMEAFSGQHPTILPARKGAIAHFLLQNWLADTMD